MVKGDTFSTSHLLSYILMGDTSMSCSLSHVTDLWAVGKDTDHSEYQFCVTVISKYWRAGFHAFQLLQGVKGYNVITNITLVAWFVAILNLFSSGLAVWMLVNMYVNHIRKGKWGVGLKKKSNLDVHLSGGMYSYYCTIQLLIVDHKI